ADTFFQRTKARANVSWATSSDSLRSPSTTYATPYARPQRLSKSLSKSSTRSLDRANGRMPGRVDTAYHFRAEVGRGRSGGCGAISRLVVERRGRRCRKQLRPSRARPQ